MLCIVIVATEGWMVGLGVSSLADGNLASGEIRGQGKRTSCTLRRVFQISEIESRVSNLEAASQYVVGGG